MKYVTIALTLILTWFSSTQVFADLSSKDLEHELVFLRQHWAHVKYELPKDEKDKAFNALIKKAEALEGMEPNNAAIQAWHGTILSSYAAFKGGLGAIFKLKEARVLLESSIAINPKAEDGLAHAVLGAVFYRIPGWPVGFKDLKKAKMHLQAALAIDPHSIDANCFYGEYLLKEGDEEAGKEYLMQALEAPARKDQTVADKGRRDEVLSLLATIKK